mmetsp:Transcript_28637/g.50921  ORF Transcript_28637/g.50921 Transcript_28637/m.50921 type:complete len:221 (-) Transcript_28637:56-718(-)
MIQATDKHSIERAVEQFGVAPGARAMLDQEMEAALAAIEMGVYIVWRVPAAKQDCTRIGPNARCFCGHVCKDHTLARRSFSCSQCPCRNYHFVPQRPEEVGEWWLPRRKEFDVRTWRASCKCKHSHEEHDANQFRCLRCMCFAFESNFLCLVCDRHWEEHETLIESEPERRTAGLPIGEDFKPLASDPRIQRMVFEEQKAPTHVRPRGKAKSVRVVRGKK